MPDRARNPLFQATPQTPTPEPAPARHVPAPVVTIPVVTTPFQARDDINDFAPTFQGGLSVIDGSTNLVAGENLCDDSEVRTGAIDEYFTFYSLTDTMTVEPETLTIDGIETSVLHLTFGDPDSLNFLRIGMSDPDDDLIPTTAKGRVACNPGTAYRYTCKAFVDGDGSTGALRMSAITYVYFADADDVVRRDGGGDIVLTKGQTATLQSSAVARANDVAMFVEIWFGASVAASGFTDVYLYDFRIDNLSHNAGALKTSDGLGRCEVGDGHIYLYPNDPDIFNDDDDADNVAGAGQISAGVTDADGTGAIHKRGVLRILAPGHAGDLPTDLTIYSADDDGNSGIVKVGQYDSNVGVRVGQTFYPERRGDVLIAGLPKARYYGTGVQAIAHATFVGVSVNTERYNSGITWSISQPTRFTIPQAGVYSVGGNVIFASNGTGYRNLAVRVNGTMIIDNEVRNTVAGGVDTYMSISTEYQFALNDYVELIVSHNVGSNLNLFESSATNHFREFWISYRGVGWDLFDEPTDF